MNTTKLFSSLNEICFKGFPDVRWNFIFGRLSLYFQCKEFDRKAKLVSILESIFVVFSLSLFLRIIIY